MKRAIPFFNTDAVKGISMKKMILIFLFLFFFASPSLAENQQSISEGAVRLQIFLDEALFRPGKIDGLDKQFTIQALDGYKNATMNQPTHSLVKLAPLYTVYKIRKEDINYIGKVPTTPKNQAKQKKMPYATLAEFVSERFHTDIPFLTKLNPQINLKKLKPGDELNVPNVEAFKIESIKKGTRPPSKPEFAKRKIKINVEKNQLMLYENEKILASFPITSGSEELPAPKGKWVIKNINYMPWFRYDKKMLNEGKRSNKFYNIPPGPNNAVGVVWMSLNKRGIGIHGTDSPETIGRATSHGCIRMSNWDVIKLSEMITPGVTVQIE